MWKRYCLILSCLLFLAAGSVAAQEMPDGKTPCMELYPFLHERGKACIFVTAQPVNFTIQWLLDGSREEVPYQNDKYPLWTSTDVPRCPSWYYPVAVTNGLVCLEQIEHNFYLVTDHLGGTITGYSTLARSVITIDRATLTVSTTDLWYEVDPSDNHKPDLWNELGVFSEDVLHGTVIFLTVYEGQAFEGVRADNGRIYLVPVSNFGPAGADSFWPDGFQVYEYIGGKLVLSTVHSGLITLHAELTAQPNYSEQPIHLPGEISL